MTDCECCDVGVQFRSWLLSIPEVAAWVYAGTSVIDTVEEEQKKPFIWFSRSGGNNSNTLSQCGADCSMSEIFYDIEIIDDERRLARTRRIAEIVRRAAETWYQTRAEPFGNPAAEFYVQMVEATDVSDNYVAKCAQYLVGIAWTSMNIEITPV